MTVQLDLFLRFGVALAIGFMVGLQREFALGRAKRPISAGERTFALIGLLGCLAAMASDELDSPLPFIAVVFLFSLFTVVSYHVEAIKGKVGLTTEFAMAIVLLIGGLCYWDHLAAAAAIGIATTLVLSLKVETDRLVRALTREDILAALKFAVISAIVLPVLPDQSFLPPPFDVLNPFKIWLMVVFISGISYLGYVAIKIAGPEQGIGLTGLLGGLASSTAVTLSLSQRSNRAPDLSKPLVLAITVAWTVMFGRVLVEVGVLNPPLLRMIWLPITASALVGLLYCVYLYINSRQHKGKGEVEFSNPFDLSAAIKFGLIYAGVLLVSRTAQLYLGDPGVIISSIISGAADVDAVTLSLAELSSNGSLSMEVAGRGILLATMSNTVTKGAIALVGGSLALRKPLLIAVGSMVVVGLGVGLVIL